MQRQAVPHFVWRRALFSGCAGVLERPPAKAVRLRPEHRGDRRSVEPARAGTREIQFSRHR